MPDIARMAIVQHIRQTQIRAAEPRPDFGDELFERIRLVAEALAERAGQPVGVARPMGVMPISA